MKPKRPKRSRFAPKPNATYEYVEISATLESQNYVSQPGGTRVSYVRGKGYVFTPIPKEPAKAK